MLWYKAVKQRSETEDGTVVNYGLAVYRFRLFRVQKILTVADISCDWRLVRCLARDATKGQLELMHLYDVIVDRLP